MNESAPPPVTLTPVASEDVPIEVRSLDRAPDSALDALTYGVIVLSPEGNIVRYNATEARMARLDASAVLGESFFDRIAPCTRTPEFEGRFRRYVREGRTDTERFGYVFDFAFGAQDVEVELVRGSLPGRYVLCVNRRHFRPPRREVPRETLAVRQAELRPGEAELGIRRDASEQRQVLVDAGFFRAMHGTWARVAPRGWPLFTAEWGVQWGRQLVADLEVASLQQHDCGLDELPLGVVIDETARIFREQGWGLLDVDLGLVVDHGIIPVEVERSAVAETIGRSDAPRCQLFAGALSALFTHLASRRVHAEEVSCSSQGHACCHFLVVDYERRRELATSIHEHGGDFDAVVHAWSGAS